MKNQLESAGPNLDGFRMSDFRLFLQSELSKRCEKNPRYSLRAFAKVLNLSPSFLSHLITGKRNLTVGVLDKIASRLDLTPQQLAQFRQHHFASKKKRSIKAFSDGLDPSIDFNQLALDHFQIIADWKHYAFLELFYLSDFQSSKRWVAKKLQISLSEVNAISERLVRVGLIKENSNGGWALEKMNNTTLGNAFTAPAMRKLQKQIIQQSFQAIDEIPLEERDHSSLTMAMDSKLIAELKDILKRCRREIAALQGKSKRCDHIYQISLAAFPITRLESTRKLNEEKIQ